MGVLGADRMTVEYITVDGGRMMPDDANRPLHSYHNPIAQRADVHFHGLTGDSETGAIRRLVFEDALTDTGKSEIEEYLGFEIREDSVQS